MGTYFKTRKLSVLVILASLTYAFLITNTFINEWDSFLSGFQEGARSNIYVNHGTVSKSPLSRYYLSLKSKHGISNYPDSLVNLLSHQTVQLKFEEAIVSDSYGSISKGSGWYDFFFLLFAFVVFVTYMTIPFHFYKLMGWINKDIIFEKEIIRLIRYLGIELLVVYFGNVLFNYMSYKINISEFSFSEYDINMRSMDAIWLLFGMVVLLIAEILSKALTIKEEQELTI